MKKITLIAVMFMALLFGISKIGLGQTTLSAGDIAIVGFAMDAPDEFTFVLLIDIESGTEINFTDNGWYASGSFRSTEQTITWTASSNLSAGTVIASNGLTGLSSSGDQILAYQGDASSPTFIYALNDEGSGVWQSDATSSNTSALPSGLTNGTTAVAIVENDNGYYNGTTTGTKSELLASISNNTNWSTSGSRTGYDPSDDGPSSFTVQSGSTLNPPSNLSIDYITSDKINITWTKPTGTYGTDWDGVIVFVADGTNETDIVEQAGQMDGADYNNANTNYNIAGSYTGSAGLQISQLVANQTTDANGNITVTNLDDGDTYYVVAYTYKTVTGDDNDDWSNASSEVNDIAEVENISNFSTTVGTAQLTLNWDNPSGTVGTWWDRIVIMASESSSFAGATKANWDALINGTTDCPSNSDWNTRSNANDVYDQAYCDDDNTNYFVYNNTGGAKASTIITGLTNNTTYYFKAMVYYEDGSSSEVWSSGANTSGTPEVLADLIITEIHYNPSTAQGDDYDYEFLEIYNNGSSSVDLEDYTFTQGMDYTFLTGASIDAGEYIIITIKSSSYSGNGYQVFEWTSGGLVNDGEDIELRNDNNVVIDYVNYDDGFPWASAADGGGPSLELINTSYDNSLASSWTSSLANEGSPGQANDLTGAASTTWIGTSTNDWAIPDEWTNNVPGTGTNVTIPSGTNYSAKTDAAGSFYKCNDLTVNAGGELTVDDILSVNGNLILESDATGTASLLVYGSGAVNVAAKGTTTVERYITEDAWHYISSPVDDPNTSVYTGLYLMWFNEPDSVWKYIVNADSTLATDMQGFAIWAASWLTGNATVSFTGSLNTGAKSISLTNTTAASHNSKGFNFVGNPYPSAVNWNNDDGNGWTRTSTNVDATLYIWNHPAGNYGTYVKDAASGTNSVDSII
ncbi:MAG: lamin tail domain-containing protein, partial [Bacteroidales bacterium]|nr:lamin tail domain-containing protein [Bacteroidales bacterium]